MVSKPTTGSYALSQIYAGWPNAPAPTTQMVKLWDITLEKYDRQDVDRAMRRLIITGDQFAPTLSVVRRAVNEAWLWRTNPSTGVGPS